MYALELYISADAAVEAEAIKIKVNKIEQLRKNLDKELENISKENCTGSDQFHDVVTQILESK